MIWNTRKYPFYLTWQFVVKHVDKEKHNAHVARNENEFDTPNLESTA